MKRTPLLGMPIIAQILPVALISAQCDRVALPGQGGQEGSLVGNNPAASAWGAGVENGWGERCTLVFFLAGERQKGNVQFLSQHHE